MDAHRLHAAIVSALALLALAGCGGTARPLTHAQLVDRADALCAAVELDVDALASLRAPAADEAVYRRYVNAERTLAESEEPLERAAARGKAEGYARRLGLKTCAARHNQAQ